MDTNIQLTDGVILLRPPRGGDIPAVAAAARESLAELRPWMDWASEHYDEAAASRWLEFTQLAWEHTSAFQFVITDAQTGEYIGNCGLDGLDEKKRVCNLNYWVRTGRAKQGLASRAARLAARFAFETLGSARVEIHIAAENVASRRVAQKIGAHYEGRHPKQIVIHTDSHDAVLYSLTPADFITSPHP